MYNLMDNRETGEKIYFEKISNEIPLRTSYGRC